MRDRSLTYSWQTLLVRLPVWFTSSLDNGEANEGLSALRTLRWCWIQRLGCSCSHTKQNDRDSWPVLQLLVRSTRKIFRLTSSNRPHESTDQERGTRGPHLGRARALTGAPPWMAAGGRTPRGKWKQETVRRTAGLRQKSKVTPLAKNPR